MASSSSTLALDLPPVDPVHNWGRDAVPRSSYIFQEFDVAKAELKSAGKWGEDGEEYIPEDPSVVLAKQAALVKKSKRCRNARTVLLRVG